MYTPPSPLTVINVNNTRQTLSKQQMHESISTQEQIWHFLSQTRTALELLDNPFMRIHPKTGAVLNPLRQTDPGTGLHCASPQHCTR